jgi:hypothetical protein
MRKTIVGVAAAAAAIGIGGAAVAGGFQYRTTATGAEEVPVNSSTAEAKLNLKLDRKSDSATSNLRITEPIENAFMAHLHKGAVGANGPVAVWLYPSAPPGVPIPGTFTGQLAKETFGPDDLCWSPTAPYCVAGEGDWDAFVADLDAGLLYLNVHTAAFPGGEVRGQVHANHEHGG